MCVTHSHSTIQLSRLTPITTNFHVEKSHSTKQLTIKTTFTHSHTRHHHHAHLNIDKSINHTNNTFSPFLTCLSTTHCTFQILNIHKPM
ncbi:hypothetical protein KSF78_0009769 [Schistosoma japonicum]|nr:hypothetical protein KSF78_0009769 [Schistosoma japonicum]